MNTGLDPSASLGMTYYMTIKDALAHTREKLNHLQTPDLDAEVLLGHVLKKPREHILSHPDETLSDDAARAFDRLVARRAQHEPVAYLTKQKEFYGHAFFVDQRAHIPRSATEDLIDAVKRELSDSFDGTLADIGTGSGCIGITLALEFPAMTVFATDVSADALAVALQNATQHGVKERITFLLGSLGEPLDKPVDVIVANLPYGWPKANRSLGGGWTEDREVFFQPEISYLAGTDGLDAISALIRDLPNLLTKHDRAFVEFDPRQTEKIKTLAKQRGLRCAIIKDTAGFDRIARLAKA